MNKEILNIVNRVLSEEMTGRINRNRRRIFESDKMCSECGVGMMNEGECTECGYMEEIEKVVDEGFLSKLFSRKDEKFESLMQEADRIYEESGECQYVMVGSYGSYVTSNPGGKTSNPLYSTCDDLEGYEEQFSDVVDESKKLSKGQKYIARQAEPKDKIDAKDFAKLRAKKTETKEGKFPDLSGDKKVTRKDVLIGRGVLDKKGNKIKRKQNESVYSIDIDGQRMIFNENEVIDIIENIILEEKKKSKKTTKLPNVTKDSLAKSKKENDDYVSDVVKKMKDYLKDASKGSFEMKPKHFPKGNGELSKMTKHAYIPSDTTKEYIENFTAASLDNIDYDDIYPNEKWVEMNYVGGSLTGNNPEWANAVETPVNKNRNELRKNNYLRRVQKMSYQKDDQPVTTDRAGQDGGEDEHRIFGMLKKATKKPKKSTNESVEGKKLISDMDNMKKLMGYKTKTQ
jgi:hypothetical protein